MNDKEVEDLARILCNFANRDCDTCHTYLYGVLKENCNYIKIAKKIITSGYRRNISWEDFIDNE